MCCNNIIDGINKFGEFLFLWNYLCSMIREMKNIYRIRNFWMNLCLEELRYRRRKASMF